MREIALNILDIAENSVKAGATLATINVVAEGNLLTVEIIDDGCGMDEEFASRAADPFSTTRTTRKVGMGLPLFRMAAEATGGTFSLKSKKGEGTTVTATFVIDSIDRMPLGNLGDTVIALLEGESGTEIALNVSIDGEKFAFDSREVKAELGDVPINEPAVLVFIRDMINENILNIGGERL